MGNRVYRYRWDGSALVEPALLLDLPVIPGPGHNGGVLTFGPDGKLYVVIGDLGRGGQLQNIPHGAAPDDTSVIIRLNDDGTIPSDHPFFSSGGWGQVMGPIACSPQGADSLFLPPGTHYADPMLPWFETIAPTALVFLNSRHLGGQHENDMFVGDVKSGNLYHFKLSPGRDGL